MSIGTVVNPHRSVGLGAALDGGRDDVWYQPILARAEEAVVGVEAMRWRVGRGATLDRVLATVLDDIIDRPARAVDGWWAVVAATPPELADPRLGTILATAAEGADGRLRLSVDAGHLAEATDAVLEAISASGVALVVDDFGAPGLSPARLRRLPVALGRIRLGGLDPDDPVDRGALGSVQALAASLGIPLVATDVETDDDLRLAHLADVAFVQGYRWGSPGPLAKVLATWARGRTAR